MQQQEKIRALTRDLLCKARVSRPPVPIETIVKSQGISVHYEPFDGNLSGAIIRADRIVVIGINSLHHPNRQRFTLAHELGHYLLHKGKDLHIDRGYRFNLRTAGLMKDPAREDWEANQFASTILMPEAMLRKVLKATNVDALDDNRINRLADKFGVSGQAMMIRLTHLRFL